MSLHICEKKLTDSRIATMLLALAAVASVIRQADILVPYRMLWYLNFTWILPAAFLLCKNCKSFLDRRLWGYYAFTTIFAVYCIVMQVVTGTIFMGKDLLNIVISIGIMATSFVYWKNYGNRPNIHFILQCLLLITAASALKLLLTVVPEIDYSHFQKGYYLKNSVAFVFLSIITFCWAEIHNQPYKNLFWWYAAIILILILILFLRSRATYLGLAFVAVYVILSMKSPRKRIYAIISILLPLMIIFFIPALHKFFIDELLLAARPLDNPNLFSSYRLSYISNEMELMDGLWWFGKGCVYLDCFPIAMIIQYGAVGSTIVFTFLGYVAWRILKVKPNTYLKEAAILLFGSFMTVAIFEAHIPFGTGIKCFAFWITLGFLAASVGRHPKIAKTEKYTWLRANR